MVRHVPPPEQSHCHPAKAGEQPQAWPKTPKVKVAPGLSGFLLWPLKVFSLIAFYKTRNLYTGHLQTAAGMCVGLEIESLRLCLLPAQSFGLFVQLCFTPSPAEEV